VITNNSKFIYCKKGGGAKLVLTASSTNNLHKLLSSCKFNYSY